MAALRDARFREFLVRPCSLRSVICNSQRRGAGAEVAGREQAGAQQRAGARPLGPGERREDGRGLRTADAHRGRAQGAAPA